MEPPFPLFPRHEEEGMKSTLKPRPTSDIQPISIASPTWASPSHLLPQKNPHARTHGPSGSTSDCSTRQLGTTHFSSTPSSSQSYSIPPHSQVYRDEQGTLYIGAPQRHYSVLSCEAPPERFQADPLVRKQESKSSMSGLTFGDNAVTEGDKVVYTADGEKQEGTVKEVVTEGALSMVTESGAVATKEAAPADPVVAVETKDNEEVVKNALEVEQKDPVVGEKRAAEEPVEAAKAEENGTDANKKLKTDQDGSAAVNGIDTETVDAAHTEPAKKKKGRPAKNGIGSAIKKEVKKRLPKKAATESGEPRRSGRNASK